MIMTKQEFIKQEWENAGFNWDEIQPLMKGDEIVVKDHKYAILINGFKEAYSKGKVIGFHISGWGYIIRVIDLNYKLSNNGWIKIESENDLPKENGIYWVMRNGWGYPTWILVHDDLDSDYWMTTYSHYQKIQKPEPPLF